MYTGEFFERKRAGAGDDSVEKRLARVLCVWFCALDGRDAGVGRRRL